MPPLLAPPLGDTPPGQFVALAPLPRLELELVLGALVVLEPMPVEPVAPTPASPLQAVPPIVLLPLPIVLLLPPIVLLLPVLGLLSEPDGLAVPDEGLLPIEPALPLELCASATPAVSASTDAAVRRIRFMLLPSLAGAERRPWDASCETRGGGGPFRPIQTEKERAAQGAAQVQGGKARRTCDPQRGAAHRMPFIRLDSSRKS
ncbi:MAG TPA: hypothetical protein VLV50_11680 [Stellaceae bacterium]|nr:hypothetical protein [Stellaceae bacterium]